MIHFVLLQNRQGKTRLAKWYTPYPTDEKRSIEVEILNPHHLLMLMTYHENLVLIVSYPLFIFSSVFLQSYFSIQNFEISFM